MSNLPKDWSCFIILYDKLKYILKMWYIFLSSICIGGKLRGCHLKILGEINLKFNGKIDEINSKLNEMDKLMLTYQ
jgi:hypothetical protein